MAQWGRARGQPSRPRPCVRHTTLSSWGRAARSERILVRARYLRRMAQYSIARAWATLDGLFCIKSGDAPSGDGSAWLVDLSFHWGCLPRPPGCEGRWGGGGGTGVNRRGGNPRATRARRKGRHARLAPAGGKIGAERPPLQKRVRELNGNRRRRPRARRLLSPRDRRRAEEGRGVPSSVGGGERK